MTQRNNVFMQYLIPKRIVTEFAGRVARATAGSHTTRLIRWFVKKYSVNCTCRNGWLAALFFLHLLRVFTVRK